MYKLISYNVNGIKAFCEKGGLDCIMEYEPHLLFFNETKSTLENFKYWTSDFEDRYDRYLSASEFKNGYAGEGLMVNKKISDKIIAVHSVDLEETYGSGRILIAELDQFCVIGIYMLNSGDKDDLRKEYNRRFLNFVQNLNKPVIILGDLNVVNEDIDYYGNLETAEELPGLKDYERSDFKNLLQDCNLVDAFRYLNPTTRTFSWFSYRGDAFRKRNGWRIDYTLVSRSLIDKVVSAKIYDRLRYSDHCPVELILDL